MTTLHAKRKVEELLQTRRAFIEVPMVEGHEALGANPAQAAIAAAPVEPPRTVDVRALRQRLGLTREPFATRFGQEVGRRRRSPG
jgi:DNA-binding transcriptional regulator YiaG